MKTMTKGKINVAVDNIFPLIKQFLYSDHEIFLRELISNATDATNKLKHLARIGEFDGDTENLQIEVKLDNKNKTLTIIDQGIGMTKDEVVKYINEIAFSGAEDFLNQYKDKQGADAGIIGHFGLGFYSAFMVADRVEIRTKSYKKNSKAVHWSCDGSPEFELEEINDIKEHGTEIILHISEDSTEFLEENRISELLHKYNKFNSIPIKFGTKEIIDPEWQESEDNKDEEPKKIIVDNIINNTKPAWTKKPSELTDEDYKNFYHELYPDVYDDPLFNIHLNVDHPFHLTGILYFPKLNLQLDPTKHRIQLFQNQVFVTDNVEGIVPEFLQMLRGVIDSPDIPLNVSRSYLQADAAVKKISGYITKKVADKLQSLFNKDRKAFEDKWNDIKIIIEYGMLSEEKFYDKALKFYLFPDTEGNYYTFEELVEKIKPVQTDKDKNIVVLYASDAKEQHAYIEEAKNKGYLVLLLDSPIVAHLLQKLEMNHSELSDQKQPVKFARVDADAVDNLIKKDDTKVSKLSEDEQNKLKEIIEKNIPAEQFSLQLEHLDENTAPFIITQPEFMRRFKEMQQTGGAMFGGNDFPGTYNLIVNTNSDWMPKILKAKKKQAEYVQQALDLAKLSQNLLKGEELTRFIKRSLELMK